MNARLIFLHGGPGYPEYLEPFFFGQFPQDIETVFYSQKRTLPVSIDDLIEELDRKVVGKDLPTFLVGHSWGGVLAVEYLRRKPSAQIKGLVLIGSFLCMEDVTTEYEKEKEMLGLADPMTEQIFLTPSEIVPAGDLIARLDASFDTNVNESIWQELVEGFDARPFIRNIQIPVLNIFGEKDVRIPSRRQRLHGDLSPRVKNLEIRGSAHFPFILPEHKRAVVLEITNFVSRRDEI